MEEIEVWTVDGSQVSRLAKSNRVESESLLEDVLVENPGLLIEGLRLVGRQTPTEGGPLDLLGVDGDGRLVVFELKRGTLNREAVAQIIDYTSDLDRMTMDELSEHISQNSGMHGIEEIEDFREWYAQDIGDMESLKPMRLFLIGLGTDDRTERMVRFLADNSGMDISLLTFHSFEYDEKTILAKQVEVEATDDSVPRSRGGYVSRARRWEMLNGRIEKANTRRLFENVRALFKKGWPKSSETPNAYSLSISLPEYVDSRTRHYAFLRIYPQGEGVMTISFYPRAFMLCVDKFRVLMHQNPQQIRSLSDSREPFGDSYAEIGFQLNGDEWERDKEKLTGLVRAVYEAWENQDTEDEPDLVSDGNGGAT